MWLIFEHTLKKPNGRWDKQALTFLLFITLTAVTGLGIIVASYKFGITENRIAYDVFTTFSIIAMGMSGTNILNKVVDYSKAKYGNNDDNQLPTNKDEQL
jgi:hypothetical protein